MGISANISIVALTSGSASALEAVRGISPAIIAVGIDAEKGVYAGAFKLVFEVSVAFGGEYCGNPFLRLS